MITTVGYDAYVNGVPPGQLLLVAVLDAGDATSRQVSQSGRQAGSAPCADCLSVCCSSHSQRRREGEREGEEAGRATHHVAAVSVTAMSLGLPACLRAEAACCLTLARSHQTEGMLETVWGDMAGPGPPIRKAGQPKVPYQVGRQSQSMWRGRGRGRR